MCLFIVVGCCLFVLGEITKDLKQEVDLPDSSEDHACFDGKLRDGIWGMQNHLLATHT